MHFLPPKTIRLKCPVTEIKEEFKELLMPYAKGIQTTGDFGFIITQVSKGAGYAVWRHHFKIKERIALYAYTDEPILSINYMLQGTPVANLPGIGTVPLIENTYQLFYVPSIKQEVWFEPGNYDCIHIVLDPTEFKKMEDRHISLKQLVNNAFEQSNEILPHASGKITKKIKALLREIIGPYTDKGEADINRHRCCLELLLDYMRTHHSTIITPSLGDMDNEEKLQEIGNFIRQNIANTLSIKMLAQRMAKSRSVFHRMFKKHFGQSPYHFLQKVRIEKAMELIVTTQYTIQEIAAMVGMEDVAHFSKSFKRFYGEPPSFYRDR